jgi:primase-polymerase (primpol)-like protein
MPVQIKTKLADEPTIKAWQDDLDRDVAKKRLPFKDNPNILDGTDPSQWHDF